MPTRIPEEMSNSNDGKISAPNTDLTTNHTSKETLTSKDEHKLKSDIEIRNQKHQDIQSKEINAVEKSIDSNMNEYVKTKTDLMDENKVIIVTASNNKNISKVHNINPTINLKDDNISSEILNTNTEDYKQDNYESDDSSQTTEILKSRPPTICGCCGVQLKVSELFPKNMYFKECKSS